MDSIIANLADHPFLVFFFSSFIGGEETTIPVAILVGRGWSSFWDLFIFCCLGSFAIDSLLFLMGRYGLKHGRFFKRFQERYQKISEFIQGISKNEFWILFVTKFVYGARTFSVIYLSLEGISLKRFLVIDVFVILVWMFLVTGFGWLIGRGSTFFTHLYKHPFILVISILALIAVFHFIRSRFAKKIIPPAAKAPLLRRLKK